MKDLRVVAVIMRSEFGEIETNLAKMEGFVKAAAEQGAAIICFPEMCVTGYALKGAIREFAEPVPGPSARKIWKMASDNDIIVIGGLAERTEEDGIAITQIVASPGEEIEKYRKLHLSEGEQAFFQEGSKVPVFRIGEVAFGVQLCYDAHFPELSGMMALGGAEILFMPHASPPPESAKEKRDRWLRYLAARAYDNSVFVVACNQAGDGGAGISFSGAGLIINPRGEVIAEASSGEERMLLAELRAEDLERTRNARMGFFLKRRRPELYGPLTVPMEDEALRLTAAG